MEGRDGPARLQPVSATDPHLVSWPAGTTVEPDGTIVFRPSWATYRSKILRAPAFLLAIVALSAFRLGDRWAIWVLVGTFVVAVLGNIVYFRRAVTRVGPSGLVHRDLLRSKALTRDELGEVIFVRHLDHADRRLDTTLIVTDAQGRRVALFHGPFWSPDQLHAMASALQQPTWMPEEPVSYLEIRARYPRAVPLMYARPMAFVLCIGAAVLGALLVGVVVLLLVL